MNPLQGVIRIYVKDKWSWFLFPWMILLFSFGINLFTAFLTGGKEDVYTGGIVAIYIYMLIAGIVTLMQTFPFVLSFSMRRTDFFLGTTTAVILVSAVTTILLYLLSLLEEMTDAWGLKLHFFYLPYLNDGAPWEQMWIYFVALVHMFFLGFVITSIYKRYDTRILNIFFGALFLLFSASGILATYYGWWGNLFHWVIHHTAFDLSMWAFGATVIYMIVSYLLLRRATV
ncbi:hypothetical protein [Kroppenstedtia sanguinis]